MKNDFQSNTLKRLSDLERDITFIYDFLTDEELRKLPFAERLAEHKEQREPLPKQRKHTVPKKGTKLDEFDVLCIRNLYGMWTMYDPVLNMIESSFLYGDDGPVLDEDGCAVEDPDYTYPETISKRCSIGVLIARLADYYSVNYRTIDDVLRGKSWPHVSSFWNPHKGGKCHAWSRPFAIEKLDKWIEEKGNLSPTPDVPIDDGELKLADYENDVDGLWAASGV